MEPRPPISPSIRQHPLDKLRLSPHYLYVKYHCPVSPCEKETISAQAMELHVVRKHDIKPSEARTLIAGVASLESSAVLEPKQAATAIKEPEIKREDSPMSEQPETKPCPECQRREVAAQLAEYKHKEELGKVKDEVTALTTQLAQEKAKPQPEPSAQVEIHPRPSAELFEHWRTCKDCQPELAKLAPVIKANVLDALTVDEVLPVMKRLNIQRAPKEIIVKSGG